MKLESILPYVNTEIERLYGLSPIPWTEIDLLEKYAANIIRNQTEQELRPIKEMIESTEIFATLRSL